MEILESYNHIQLTQDEITEAMILAKRKKEEEIRIQNIRAFEDENRKRSKERWNIDMIKTFMVTRAKKLFDDKFIIDDENEKIFDLLCSYFIEDSKFVDIAIEYGVKNPSLQKGLMLVGNFGSGKSWLMKIFQQNSRKTFWIRSAKQIANDYLVSRDKIIPEEYTTAFKNPVNDSSVFYQETSGLCIDDLGAENEKNNFGNVTNVIGDLIEQRYSSGLTGLMLHASTNLSADELRGFYGERVTSRMREVFNFIKLTGKDRRK